MNKIFSIVFFALALIVILTPSFIAPVCGPMSNDMGGSKCMSDTEMKCDLAMKSDNNMKADTGMDKEPMKHKKYMKCHWMGEAIKATGITMAALAVALFTLKNPEIRKGIIVGNILSGLQLIMHIFFIGGCMKPTMPCRTRTIPTVILVAGIYIITSFYYLVRTKNNVINQDG